jgi:maltose-binding protein MalE
MGKFWGAMTAAFQIATNGGATPEVALKDARKSMQR